VERADADQGSFRVRAGHQASPATPIPALGHVPFGLILQLGTPIFLPA
jgi:hypothetical protein